MMTNKDRFKALISKEETDSVRRMKKRRKYRRLIHLKNWLYLTWWRLTD